MTKKWTTKDFPVGLYDLHPDQSVNFQMNRFFNWSNDLEMLDEMKKAGGSIHSYDDFVQSFINLGKEALNKDEILRAALYFRGAEFFIPEGGLHKQNLRNQFISLSNAYYSVTKDQHYLIPYGNGFLSAYRFTPENPKGTIVLLNGFMMAILKKLPEYCWFLKTRDMIPLLSMVRVKGQCWRITIFR